MKFTLEKEVVVSDPCYELGTWCQEIVSGVKPGVYRAKTTKLGGRIATLTALHADAPEKPKWAHYSYNVGVDSGQAGIFCHSSYRKDDTARSLPWTLPEDSVIREIADGDAGDHWYAKMCNLTLSDQGWGGYDTGVVSSSGWGDGSYELSICYEGDHDDNEIEGLKITFIEKSDLE